MEVATQWKLLTEDYVMGVANTFLTQYVPCNEHLFTMCF